MSFGLHHFTYHYQLPDNRSPLLRDPKIQRIINKSVYAVTITGIAVTIPQVLKVWSDSGNQGVSIISWMGFAFSASFWLLYGLLHKDKAIILSSSAGIIMDILIVVGVLLHP